MRRLPLKRLSLFLTITMITAFSAVGVASAHVVVLPAQAGIASFQIFTVNVPTVAVKLLLPPGLDEVVPTVKSGWTINTKTAANGTITEIDWTGGSIPPNLRDDFTFSAQVPAQPTDLHWKAYQTYQDGSVVSWDATPSGSDDATGDKGPYSITHVVNDLNPPTNTKNSIFPYLLSGAAFVIAVLSFVRTFSVKRRHQD